MGGYSVDLLLLQAPRSDKRRRRRRGYLENDNRGEDYCSLYGEVFHGLRVALG